MIETGNSYVYFALIGDNFEPKELTDKLGINPTEAWKKGDKGKYNPALSYSCWKISTDKGKEYFDIDKLVDELVEKLNDKVERINELKEKYLLDSVLQIVMDIDTNPEQSTPSLGHDLKTIDFLYQTRTKTDVDIYKFNSLNK